MKWRCELVEQLSASTSQEGARHAENVAASRSSQHLIVNFFCRSTLKSFARCAFYQYSHVLCDGHHSTGVTCAHPMLTRSFACHRYALTARRRVRSMCDSKFRTRSDRS